MIGEDGKERTELAGRDFPHGKLMT